MSSDMVVMRMSSYSLYQLGLKNVLPAEVYNLMKFKPALLYLVYLPFNDMCNIGVMAKGGVVLDCVILRGVWVTAISECHCNCKHDDRCNSHCLSVFLTLWLKCLFIYVCFLASHLYCAL